MEKANKIKICTYRTYIQYYKNPNPTSAGNHTDSPEASRVGVDNLDPRTIMYGTDAYCGGTVQRPQLRRASRYVRTCASRHPTPVARRADEALVDVDGHRSMSTGTGWCVA